MQHVDLPERAAAVARLVEDDIGGVDGVGILRVRRELHVIPGAHPQLVVVVDPRPRGSAVVGAVDAARVGLDQRPDPRWLGGRDGEPDVPEQSVRQPGVLRELLPVGAAVGGLEDAAALASRDQLPREALRLPERGVERVRVRGVHCEVRGARGIVARQDSGPRLPTVGRLVDAALGVGAESTPLRGHVHDVGVGRVHADAGDLLRLGESQRGPRPAAVRRFVHAGAGRHVAADRVFARPHVDDVGVGLAHADRADRAAEILVADREPRLPAVGGLEHAAAGRAHPELVRAGGGTRDGHRAATAEDPDLAPFQRGEYGRVVRGLRLGCEA